MNRIILMTDFSDNARNAIKYAIKLFGNTTEYLLVNAFTVRSSAGSLGNLSRAVKKTTEVDLQRELNTLKSAFPDFDDLKISSLCKHGEPVSLVNELHNKGEADLVVMGTKGSSGLSKILMGSVTTSIIKNTKVPVLSIPEKAVFTSMNKIVFAADLNSNRKKELTSPLKKIAQDNNAEVLLLHVIKEDERSNDVDEDKLAEIALNFNLENVQTSLHSKIAEDTIGTISDFCKEENADLLTVIARHNTFLEGLFHKSVSRELAFSLKMPMLTLEDSF